MQPLPPPTATYDELDEYRYYVIASIDYAIDHPTVYSPADPYIGLMAAKLQLVEKRLANY